MEQQQQLLLVLIVLGFAGFAGSAGFAGFAGSAGGAEEVCVGPADCGTKTYDDCNHPCEWVSIAEADQIAEQEDEVDEKIKKITEAKENAIAKCGPLNKLGGDPRDITTECCMAMLEAYRVGYFDDSADANRVFKDGRVLDSGWVTQCVKSQYEKTGMFDCNPNPASWFAGYRRDCLDPYIETGKWPGEIKEFQDQYKTGKDYVAQRDCEEC